MRSTLAAVVILSIGLGGRPSFAASCDELAALKLADTTIVQAQVVPAGAFVPPAGGRGGRGNAFAAVPAFCRVTATVKPTSDSDIQIEIWLPTANWNGKFQAAGGANGANSAVGGSINYGPMATAVRAGFATAGTDNGHQGATLSFAPGHPEQVIDYGYRATHEMTIKAKAMVETFYGSGPRYSYWNACAAGGRQGMQEAQRFPSDYDGIVTIAPANSWSRLQAFSMWVYQVANANPAGVIPPAKYPALHKAVIDQCDMLDGVQDGIIENPTRCHPRLDVLVCKAGEDSNRCLTPPQVATANAIYATPTDPRTGRPVYAPLPPGTELGWAALGGTNAPYYASETFKYLVFDDPSWNPATRPINLGADLDAADKTAAAVTGINPDLSAFFARGGKLIQVHGWTDNLIPPGDSVNYYTSVRDKVGARTVEQNYRLFMVPGMNHCAGGEGADSMDLQTAIESWVEKGQAPSTITASKVVGGEVKRTHLLCPYPQEAVYKGTGSVDAAASFECKVR